jgi:FAD/FMN-containing dehydrogenase
MALQAFNHLPYWPCRHLIHQFWEQERKAMLAGGRLTRNEALHPPINAFKILHHSNLHTQWLQEYFIKEENLPNFLRFLGAQLKANEVRVINATIRPTPRDPVSILPYAEQDRFAVVICFSQEKTKKAVEQTRQWIQGVNQYLVSQGDIYYQAYMPFATREQFEQCYGKERIEKMQELKAKYDPSNMFSNGHTKKYFDPIPQGASHEFC